MNTLSVFGQVALQQKVEQLKAENDALREVIGKSQDRISADEIEYEALQLRVARLGEALEDCMFLLTAVSHEPLEYEEIESQAHSARKTIAATQDDQAWS